MASLYNANLKPLENGKTHPYDHATKLFVADNLRLAPKQSFLYYVCINIDTSVLASGSILQSIVSPSGVSSQTLIEQYEMGLMAKRVELPKFTLATKTMNAYNRKNIIQTNIQYDPISITFHDDAADVVTNFWNDYYTYYYRDSDYFSSAVDPGLYTSPHKYQSRQREGWGYSPRNNSLTPFLRNIQIFSLHNKRFTEYLLVNPFISSWRHGEHDSSAGTSTMENAMTISYESVKYRTGWVNAVDVNGFGILHYDNFDSPISTSTTNIFTDGGFFGAVEGSSKDLARPDGTMSGNSVYGSVLNAFRFYNNMRNANFGSVVGTVIGQVGLRVLNGAINSAFNNYVFPTMGGYGGYSGYGSSYGSSQVYGGMNLLGYSPFVIPGNSFAATLGNTITGIVGGALIQSAAVATDNWVRGAFGQPTNQYGYGYGQGYNPTVYQTMGTSGYINVNNYGQPLTGQYTGFMQSANGQQVLGQQQTYGTSAAGAFNPANKYENFQYATEIVAEDGSKVTEYVYKDGTKARYSGDTLLQVYPGTSNYSVNAPTNASAYARNGNPVPANVPQYYTDPRTGIVHTTGGSVSAYMTNTISGATGLIGGAYIGQGVNNTLMSSGLGKTVLGQVVAGTASTAIAMQMGRVINNGMQPVMNAITGSVSQGWDALTGSIKNVVGSWTDKGGYDTKNPTQNIVSSQSFDDGSKLFVYKDGTTRSIASNGVETIDKPTETSWWGTSSTTPGTNSDTSSMYGGVVTDRYGDPITNRDGTYLTYGDQGLAQSQASAFTAYNTPVAFDPSDPVWGGAGPGPSDVAIIENNAAIATWDEWGSVNPAYLPNNNADSVPTDSYFDEA